MNSITDINIAGTTSKVNKGCFPEMWSPTVYGDADIDAYASKIMESEVRVGVRCQGLIFFGILVFATLLNKVLGSSWLHLYSYALLAVLSLHTFLSAKKAKGIAALYLLSVTLLVLSSTCLVLLAHRSGTFTMPLFVTIFLIFIIVPLVPWGLKEASLVVLLIYLIFTASSLSAHYNFAHDSLFLLQFLMTSASVIVLTIVARNTSVRRTEIKNMYQLEGAKVKLHKLSCEDPLTGAWNRRYLKTRFAEELAYHLKKKKNFCFALLDVDQFKSINDTYGHDFGDKVLQWVVSCFGKCLKGPHDVLIRMGGDEFVFLLSSVEPEETLDRGIEFLSETVRNDTSNSCEQINVSIGLTIIVPDENQDFSTIYLAADHALYIAKESEGSFVYTSTPPVLGQTA